LYVASITEHQASFQKVKFFDRIKLSLCTNGRPHKPRNFDNFAPVSRIILRMCPRNLAKFFSENCGP